MSLRRLFMLLPSCTISAILGVFHANKRVDQRAHGFVGCLLVGSSTRSVVMVRSRCRSQTVFQASHGACHRLGVQRGTGSMTWVLKCPRFCSVCVGGKIFEHAKKNLTRMRRTVWSASWKIASWRRTCPCRQPPRSWHTARQWTQARSSRRTCCGINARGPCGRGRQAASRKSPAAGHQ